MDEAEEKEESPCRARRRINLKRQVGEVGGAAQLSREAETPKSHISVLLSGKRGLGDALTGKLEALYTKHPGWFDSELPHVSSVAKGPEPSGVVPLISRLPAGQWCGAEDPLMTAEAERWMPCPAPHGPSTYALRIREDSMTAPSGNGLTYPESCLIYVDPDKSSPVNGDRLIARPAGTDEVTFKVFQEKHGRRWLLPLNPTHLPIRDEFSVCGTSLESGTTADRRPVTLRCTTTIGTIK